MVLPVLQVYEERRRQRDLEREREDEAQAAEVARWVWKPSLAFCDCRHRPLASGFGHGHVACSEFSSPCVGLLEKLLLGEAPPWIRCYGLWRRSLA